MIDDRDIDLALLLLRSKPCNEGESRAALVRILECNEPVPLAIRYQLAALFEPSDELFERFEIKIERRRGGRPDETEKSQLLVSEILDRTKRGERVSSVVRQIHERECISERRLWKLWQEFKTLFGQYVGLTEEN